MANQRKDRLLLCAKDSLSVGAAVRLTQNATHVMEQVYRYTYLDETAQPPFSVNSPNNVAALQYAHNQLLTDILNGFENKGRPAQSFPIFSLEPAVSINADNTPGFADGLKSGVLTFYIGINETAFDGLVCLPGPSEILAHASKLLEGSVLHVAEVRKMASSMTRGCGSS